MLNLTSMTDGKVDHAEVSVELMTDVKIDKAEEGVVSK